MINCDHNDIRNHELFDRLEFTADWLEFLSVALLNDLKKELVPNEDPNPGHFKWKVFNLVLQQLTVPADASLTALYALAEKESNPKLRDTFICAVIRHDGCPDCVLKQAAVSDTGYIADMARKKQGDQRT